MMKSRYNRREAGNFSWFNFAEFGFFRFRGKKNREFGFRGFHVHYLEVTKMEAIWSFLSHCLQFSNVKKKLIFAGFLLEGVCFHRIKLSQMNEKSSEFAII